MVEISAIFPPRTPTWRTASRPEAGSTTRPLLITRSNGCCAQSDTANRNGRTRCMKGLYILVPWSFGRGGRPEHWPDSSRSSGTGRLRLGELLLAAGARREGSGELRAAAHE